MGSATLPPGLKVIVGFHILSAVLWILGQTGAVFWYDVAVYLGLQEPLDEIDPALVAVNVSIGMADTLVLIPLHVASAAGIVLGKFYGPTCSWMNFACTMYWTTVFWTGLVTYSIGDVQNGRPNAFSIVITVSIFLFAAWGSWYQCRCRELVGWWRKDFDAELPQLFLSVEDNRLQPLGRGLGVIVAFHSLAAVLLLLGQTFAIFAYDRVASWGLQEPRDEQDPSLTYYNICLAATDTLIQLPLHLMALYGIVRREFYGIICSWMAMGLTLYWPAIYVSGIISFKWHGIDHADPGVSGWFYAIFFFAFALWASWFEFRSERLISWWVGSFEDSPQGVAATEIDPLVKK